jgi:preprotein translocase subunit Sec63
MARAPRVAPTREARPPRPMNAVQRMAFELLNLAGASLATDFTNAELKGAFRRLARELHPDMHRNVTAERRTSLGMQFAEIREAYELLLKIRT